MYLYDLTIQSMFFVTFSDFQGNGLSVKCMSFSVLSIELGPDMKKICALYQPNAV